MFEFSNGHQFSSRFEHQNGHLLVGGRPLAEIAESLPDAPFYVYDRRVIREQVEALREHLPQSLHLHYAIKANPMPAVVADLGSQVEGLDVASELELGVALQSGMAADRISFAGPGKRNSELEAAIRAGITLNIESPGELRRVAELSKKLARPAKVAVRVNPDFQLKTSGMKMGGGPQQFGIDAEIVPDILRAIAEMDSIDLQGLHIYSGSQNLRSEAIVESQVNTVDLAIELSKHADKPLRTLNIGGGLGIPYFPGDTPLDLAPIGENLHALVELGRKKLPDTTLIMEMGRFLVGECGLYVSRIVDKKVSRGKTFLVTAGGLHHHLAASGNFGQVIRKNYPVCIGNRTEGPTERVTVVGPLCTPLDLMASNVELPVAEPGDLFVVFQSGAYGLSASPLNFLSHPAPGEILV